MASDRPGYAERSGAPPTIADVAAHAGVAVGTVSRVLNNARNCSPEMRVRVRNAIDALGYVPNHAARSLKRQLTEQIALVVPDVANPVYVQMAAGVQAEAQARGFHLTLISSDGDPAEERHALQSVEANHVDGVILCSLQVTAAFVREVSRLSAKVCVIGGLPLEVPVDNVRVDSAEGVALGVQHLLDAGRKRVAFLNGLVGTVPHRVRDRGFRQALEANGVAFDEALVAHADFTIDGGYAAIDVILERRPDMDAIMCANDGMALGVLRRLRERGLDVPGDVAVVGMDDIDVARMSMPALTSVSLLARERGRLATECLLERLGGRDDGHARKVTVSPRLIVRESSDAP